MLKDSYSLSVSQLMERAYLSDRSKTVIYDGLRRMTYKELWDESLALAVSLREMEVQKGDRVAVCLPNWHEFVVINMALAHLGAILVPLNTRYQVDELEYILSNSGAKVVFSTKEADNVDLHQHFTNIIQRLNSLLHLVTVRFEDEGFVTYQELLEREVKLGFSPVDIQPKEDVFTILYTSGTTGKPKGAMLTHANVVYAATITNEVMRCNSNDVFLVAVPLFHVFGLVLCALGTIECCAGMVLMERYNAKESLQLIQEERVTVHHGVPTMFILELNHPNFSSYDLSSLRTGLVSAAPCPIEIVRQIRYEMGLETVVGYGLSECSPTVALTDFNDDDIVKTETVGKAVHGVEVKIVNSERKEVANGEIGELAARSPGVMKGYYNMPEKTKEALDEDGWFYTGDLATRDEQGYIRIVGRIKEMIIRGGYNIYPREIEEVLYTHPFVEEVAIVGLPDTVLGEISCAVVRPKHGVAVDVEELMAFIRAKVADYKAPDKIVIVDQLPMTSSGKIKKIDLQSRLKEDLKEQLR